MVSDLRDYLTGVVSSIVAHLCHFIAEIRQIEVENCENRENVRVM